MSSKLFVRSQMVDTGASRHHALGRTWCRKRLPFNGSLPSPPKRKLRGPTLLWGPCLTCEARRLPVVGKGPTPASVEITDEEPISQTAKTKHRANPHRRVRRIGCGLPSPSKREQLNHTACGVCVKGPQSPQVGEFQRAKGAAGTFIVTVRLSCRLVSSITISARCFGWYSWSLASIRVKAIAKGLQAAR